jgi:DNA-binding transcriptional LysR family regulator
MELNELNAFVSVAETGSFSLAAERLYLTQPAVSKRIAALEEKLGTRLFDRLGRKTNLTEAGLHLLPRARGMLDEMNDIQRSLSNLSGMVKGTLSMGTSHHIGLHRLPPVLRAFSEHYPEVRLDIRFLDSETACAAVERGDLELAIVTLPPDPSPELETNEIWPDPLEFVVSANHPLAAHKRITLKKLAEHPAVLPGRGTFTRNILEQILAPLRMEIEIAISTNYLETLKMLVSTGLGWSLLPRTMIKESALHILAVQGVRPARRLGTVIHRSRTLSNAAQAMLESCRS